jgi:D-serine dehydratase
MWIKTKEGSSKGIIPLEDEYWHLLETPFHNYFKRFRVVLLGYFYRN